MPSLGPIHDFLSVFNMNEQHLAFIHFSLILKPLPSLPLYLFLFKVWLFSKVYTLLPGVTQNKA